MFTTSNRSLLLKLLFLSIIPASLFGRQSPAFQENKGQVIDMSGRLHSEVFYTLKLEDKTVYFTGKGAYYVFPKYEKRPASVSAGLDEEMQRRMPDQVITKVYRMDMEWQGSSDHCQPIASEELRGRENFYYSHCPDGIMDVKNFGRITYQNLYPDIDVVYYLTEKAELKYDIIVHPGGNPERIAMKFDGTSGIFNDGGKLTIRNSIADLVEDKIYAYQQTEKGLSAQYIIKGNTVRFAIDGYNKVHNLVIDPLQRKWATFCGGSSDDYAAGGVPDGNGNYYVCMYSASTSLPSSTGIFQTNLAGGQDFFLLKLDKDGNKVWATYYGGTSNEVLGGIDVDKSGNIVMAGGTASSNFPVSTSAFQSSNAGGANDACLVKFNSSGTRQWATYLGGSGSDVGTMAKTDASGNVLIVGFTQSSNLPVTSGAFQTSFGGTWDCIIGMFDASGARKWVSYYGGNGEDATYNAAFTKNGDFYISGYETSTNFPVSNNPFQSNTAGGYDCYLLKFDNSGNRLWATAYGGTGDDKSYGVRADTAGNAYFCAYSSSTNFPVTSSAYQTSNKGGRDGVLVKFNGSGGRVWSTYIGGSSDEWFGSIAIAPDNSIWMVGSTFSSNFPVTSDAFQSSIAGDRDLYIVNFSPSCSLKYATYYGGSLADWSGDCNVSGPNIYIDGHTSSTNFPVSSSGVLQSTKSSLLDVFVISLYDNRYPTTPSSLLAFASLDCKTVRLGWVKGNGDKIIVIAKKGSAIKVLPKDSTVYKANSNFGSGSNLGDSTFVLMDSTTNYLTVSNIQPDAVYYFAVIEYNLVNQKPLYLTSTYASSSYKIKTPKASFSVSRKDVCFGSMITFTDSSNLTRKDISRYDWNFGDGTLDTGLSIGHNYKSTGTYLVSLKISTVQGCIDSTKRNITVNSVPTAAFSINSYAQCITEPFLFTNSSTSTDLLTYTWKFGDGNLSSLKDPVHIYKAAGSYKVKLITTTNRGCQDSIEKSVTVYEMPVALFSGDTLAQCLKGNLFQFVNKSTSTAGTLQYSWRFGDGQTSTSTDVAHHYTNAGVYTIKLKVTSVNGCTDSFSKKVIVNASPIAYFKANGTCLGYNTTFNNLSTAGAGVTYSWDFGDGYSSTLKVPKHNYSAAGKYSVVLLVKEISGCTDTLRQTLEMFSSPKSNFTYLVVTKGTYKFNPVDNSLSRYRWSFGDGDTSGTITPMHTYKANGLYTVKLITQNASGCTDTTTISINIVVTDGIGTYASAVSGFSAYPDPFTDQLTVSYQLDQPSIVSLSLMDLNGKVLSESEKGRQTAGDYKTGLEMPVGVNFPAGIYLLRLTVDGYPGFLRVVKLK